MDQSAKPLEQTIIASNLHTDQMGRHLICLAQTDSTNEYLKRTADTLPHGTLVIADVQNAGKGSKGRSWSSPAGSGIWMSLLLKPAFSMEKAPMLTLVMAVSVARASRQLCKLPVLIKWPNDIVCHGKKLCGILTEMKTGESGQYAVVAGLGINVNTGQFPAEIADRATSFFLETGNRWSRELFVSAVMNCFEEDYQTFTQTGDLQGLLRTYSRYSATIGSQVEVLDPRGSYRAEAISVGKDGHLLVEKEDHTVVQVFADEVSVRGVYGYA